jgi:hypothetical protein
LLATAVSTFKEVNRVNAKAIGVNNEEYVECWAWIFVFFLFVSISSNNV